MLEMHEKVWLDVEWKLRYYFQGCEGRTIQAAWEGNVKIRRGFVIIIHPSRGVILNPDAEFMSFSSQG